MAARKRILLAEISPRVPAHPVYANWNPADKDASVSLSAGNLTASKSVVHATQWGLARATNPMRAGSFYWETTYAFTGAADVVAGLAKVGAPLNIQPGITPFTPDGNLYSVAGPLRSGACYVAGGVVANVGTLVSGTIVRHWLDLDAMVYRVARGGDPWVTVLSGNNLYLAIARSPIYPCVGLLRPSGGTCSATANFGASPFAYPVSDGVSAGIYSIAAPSTTTVNLASSKYNTNAGEVPSNTTYSARILPEPDVEIEREITCVAWGGSVVSRRGQMVITNNDNKLDDWAWWIWRDAPYTLYSGYEGDPRSAFEVWSSGKVEQLNTTDAKRHVIVFADPLSELDRPALPENYPDSAANEQIRNQPKPFLLGRPLYCEGVRLSTADIGTDAWKYDLDYLGLDGVDAVFDRGDIFKGPNDPYAATTPITLANGGAFTVWANDTAGIPMPQNWSRVTAFTATDRFQQGTTAGTLRMLSGGQVATAIYHSTGVHGAGNRFQISFTVTALTTPGNIVFRLDGNAPGVDDVLAPITSTGAKTVTLDCTDANYGLQILLGSTQLDATIDNLTSSSVQVIDWTTPDNKGFKLSNKPAGRVVANPRGAREAFDWITLRTFKEWDADNPVGWEILGGPETATRRITQSGASARFQAPAGSGTYIGMAYADAGRVLRAGHTYFVSVGCSAAAAGQVFVMVDNGSGTSYGSVNAVGNTVITVTPATSGRLYFRTPNGTATDISLSYVQVSDVRVAEGLPDFMRQLLFTRAGLAESAVDWASLLAVDDGMPDENDVIPGRLAYYSRQQQTYAQIVRAAMDSFNGWCVPNRLGQLTFGALRAPSRTPVLVLNKNNLATRPRIRPDLAPGLSTKLAGARNHSPHSDGDIADSVPAPLRAALIEEFTRTVSAAPTLLEAGLKPVSDLLLQAIGAPAIRTLLQEERGMQVVVNIMATLYRDLNCFIDVDAVLPASTADELEPGQTVQLVWDGYGLSNGANFVVKRVAGRFFGRIVPLTLWGKNASAD